MVTMMEHPQHGRHPATGAEVEALKANGWAVMAPRSKEEKKEDGHLDLLKKPIKENLPSTNSERQKRKYTKRAV